MATKSQTTKPEDKNRGESSESQGPLEHPWSLSVEDTLERLGVDTSEGLSGQEVIRKRKRYGRNALREHKARSWLAILVDQFKSPIIGLLAIAAVLSLLFEHQLEGFSIIGAILLNTIIGFVTELKAVRSMDALRQMSRVTAKVRREGKASEVPAQDLVVGDVVILEGGEIISADLRLTEAAKLQMNESALTGESEPVAKQTDELGQDTDLAERNNMAFKGTAVTGGSGEGIVVSTGTHTELGKISEMLAEAEGDLTPLEKRLSGLANNLIWVTLGLAAVVAAIGIVRHKELLLMIKSAIALAVAAVPEGLPIVATVALARGMLRMAKRNALTKRLSSVETLGATNIICTDKTGTLTENEMTLSRLALPEGDVEVGDDVDFVLDGNKTDPEELNTLKQALLVGALCSNASLGEDDQDNVGEPLEVALLVAARWAGMNREELLQEYPEEREVAFDTKTKMMATFHRNSDGYLVAVKGAPERVIECCTTIAGDSEKTEFNTDQWRDKADQLSADGLRLLALATKQVDDEDAEPYENLTFLGLAGLFDPPREGIDDAISLRRQAGIRVVMVTGDHKLTARNIAHQVGIADSEDPVLIEGRQIGDVESLTDDDRHEIAGADVLYRVDPEQKLNLISIYQQEKQTVAMTGDGVNDAPALKKADIGIAMGERGTQVAQEAADMVLRDDAFSTIVTAVEQGRIIFGNIRNFILYLLSGNAAEIIAVAAASLIGAPLPLLPLQILFLNVVLDVFPALALGLGEGDKRVMQMSPRDPQEPILTRRNWVFIGSYGTVIAVSVLAALAVALYWLGLDEPQAVTVSFLTLAFARLWHVFNIRDYDSNLIRNQVSRNPYVWGAIAICLVIILGAVFLPGISRIISAYPPGLNGWLVAIIFSLLPLVIGQSYKLIKKSVRGK
jgi:Ca2+-transporting ATPase